MILAMGLVQIYIYIYIIYIYVVHKTPETNMAPENRGPLEKQIPIGHHFRGLC